MFGFLTSEKRKKLLEYGFCKKFIKEFSKNRLFFKDLKQKKAHKEFCEQISRFINELEKEGFTEQEIYAIKNIYSPTQKIYLTRHGITSRNIFVKESSHPKKMQMSEKIENDLSDKGRTQARILGKYLREIMPASADVLFVTSKLIRTQDTAEIISKELGIPFQKQTYATLNDMIPEEKINKIDSPGFKQWYEYKKKEGVIATKKDIGKKIFSEILKISKANKNKTIFAALHQAVNEGLLEEADHPAGTDYTHVENCSLVVLERTGNRISVVLKYISNEKMSNMMT